MHGDDDQIVPIDDSARLSIKLLKHGTLKVYPSFPHGMCTVNADVINADLVAFSGTKRSESLRRGSQLLFCLRNSQHVLSVTRDINPTWRSARSEW
jgi:hypothetical protein